MVSLWRDQLLRQEKDEAGPFRGCGRESLNAFILRFAGGEGFFVPHPSAGLAIVNPLRQSELSKDQRMSKIGLFVLVLASLVKITPAMSETFTEDFSSNPAQKLWHVFGNTNLFQWDRTNENLQVTWDSSQPNSYFYYPLVTVLDSRNDFTLAFDWQLTDIGPHPGTKASTFQIAIGLLNLEQATQTNFIRGTGIDSPDLAEVDYFWDSGFGATVYPTFTDTNSTFNFNGASDYALFALATNAWYHVVMSYSASNQTAITTITNSERTSGARATQLLNANFADYRVDTLSISSYSDAGQDPQYAGSVLAHGKVDNLAISYAGVNAFPPPLADIASYFSNGLWQVQFVSQTNWLYTLERTIDFKQWTSASATLPGNGSGLVLTDTNLPSVTAFYRVRANGF
jgi:hypothetical protein